MFRIFGPPGTGKTTTLLDMVDKALSEGIPSNTIAFLAFTRKAATEAKERAAQRFKLDPKHDLPYFRTLHSLALQCSDIRKDQIMQAEHYRELSNSMGVSIVSQVWSDFSEDITDISSTNDPILGVINLARLRKVDLKEQYNQSQLEKDWTTVKYVDKCLKEYKKAYSLYDFTDMLEQFVMSAEFNCPRFSMTFLDEAQAWLRSGGDVDARTQGREATSRSRLYHAAKRGYLSGIRLLLDHGASLEWHKRGDRDMDASVRRRRLRRGIPLHAAAIATTVPA